MKCSAVDAFARRASSHPARGAWIEIKFRPGEIVRVVVAPRKGCVD